MAPRKFPMSCASEHPRESSADFLGNIADTWRRHGRINNFGRALFSLKVDSSLVESLLSAETRRGRERRGEASTVSGGALSSRPPGRPSHPGGCADLTDEGPSAVSTILRRLCSLAKTDDPLRPPNSFNSASRQLWTKARLAGVCTSTRTRTRTRTGRCCLII